MEFWTPFNKQHYVASAPHVTKQSQDAGGLDVLGDRRYGRHCSCAGLPRAKTNSSTAKVQASSRVITHYAFENAVFGPLLYFLEPLLLLLTQAQQQ